MWLVDTTTLELKFFANTDDTEYAILSHTWADGEVLFQDMNDPSRASQKPGWAKIQKTCEIALRDHGLAFAWVDTCCIDKSSSAELSEAINSMFSWYKLANVCLAYLSDYDLSIPVNASECSGPDTEVRKSLARCRWFKRGWTLQELIAPRDIVFYDGSWSVMGTKGSLELTLTWITGIDSAVLSDVRLLETINVGKRMSWAAQRGTTRVEDTAYCLLGLFNINMPLLYGEGPKAFIRLQQEIARSTNDLTLFAWESDQEDGVDYTGILAKSPCDFKDCGRLKKPHPKLLEEVEFSFTNRGLRLEGNLAAPIKHHGIEPSCYFYSTSGNEFILDLNCVKCSDRTEISGQPRWMGILLERAGSTLVRKSPHKLMETRSRSFWYSEPTKKSVYYIALDYFEPTRWALKTMGGPPVDIYYNKELFEVCTGGRSRSEPQKISDESIGGLMKPARVVWTDFPLSLHFFTISPHRNTDTKYRFVLACGLSRSYDINTHCLWSGIYGEDEFLHAPHNPLSHPGAFRGSTDKSSDPSCVLSYKEKRARFYDHIFLVSSDDTGNITQNLMPDRLRIMDKLNAEVIHEVSLQQITPDEDAATTTPAWEIALHYQKFSEPGLPNALVYKAK